MDYGDVLEHPEIVPALLELGMPEEEQQNYVEYFN